MRKRVLLVCGGNTCRSPMAAGIGTALFPELEWISAGVAVAPGTKVAEGACHAVHAITGGDISGHTPTDLEESNLRGFDAIVALDAVVGEELRDTVARRELPVRLIIREVSDPYRKSQAVYVKAAIEIRSIVAEVAEELLGLRE